MLDCVVVDSNLMFAEALYRAVTRTTPPAPASQLIGLKPDDTLIDIAERIRALIIKDTVILINAEACAAGKYRQQQPTVDLAFRLRCQHKSANVIVFYSWQSLGSVLRQRPQNLILVSPGCYHLQLPLTTTAVLGIPSLKPVTTPGSLKPYLQARIDLRQTRHRYANYMAMLLMMTVAQRVWDVKKPLLNQNNPLFAELKEFLSSLDYVLLETYFDLFLEKPKPGKLAYLKHAPPAGKILLVDDLAEGWQPIITQMLYGNAVDNRLISLSLQGNTSSTEILNVTKTWEALRNSIESEKPHLILLDLRLNGDEGETDLEKLTGYQLLKLIKHDPGYRGVPVIVFTASANPANIKRLLRTGAEGIWTKPGIDEGLISADIRKRYQELLNLVRDSFEPNQRTLRLLDDNTDRAFDITKLDFESIRNLLLNQLARIKYRSKLYTLDERSALIPSPYASADAIYVDANIFLNNKYAQTISAVYQLAWLTAGLSLRYMVGSRQRAIQMPKLVIMNSVYDELLKTAKVSKFERTNGKNRLLYLRAMISQSIVREMFADGVVRSELYRNSQTPSHHLDSPKEKVYADGYILDEIANMVVTHHHHSKRFGYCDDTKIVFVTDDKGLATKLLRFESNGNLIICSGDEVISHMTRVVL